MIHSLLILANSDFFFGFLILLFLAEIPIGITQLIGALVRTINRLNKGESIGNLKNYWIMVGVYFFVAGLMYLAYLYFVDAFFNSDANYDMDRYETQAKWTGILSVASIVWIAAAWIIAIWYWINVVFKKKPKVEVINA